MLELIQKVIERENLSLYEAHFAMSQIMTGEINNSQIAAFLTAIAAKGETAEEVAGFIKAMRDRSQKVHSKDNNAIDVCGTGGDSSGTFNISTAVAFVVAGAGVTVAKHGNRSITSKSGSADVLKSLAVNIDVSRDQNEAILNEIGITFMFAPLYHPAMVYAVPVRRELGFRTVFNILGPLTNPASVKKQIVGTFNNRTAKLMAEAAKFLGYESIKFVCTEDKYDELTLTSNSKIITVSGDQLEESEFIPVTYGFKNIQIGEIKGGAAEENANIILSIIRDNKDSAAKEVVLANASLALQVAGVSDDLNVCKAIALESIAGGNALKKLNQLVDRTNS